jgi:hypothetical protein
MAVVPTKVTCTERVRMNAIAGFLFVAAGDGIILYAFFSDNSGTFGSLITGICGAAAVFLGLYYMCCFMNKKITVTQDGVDYSNWIGKTKHYTWTQVEVAHRVGRNAKFVFRLDGKNVSFYGYAINALALHEFLLNNNKYDNDTMREEEKAAEQEAERIRMMQRKAQADASDWEDDDEGWD